jgi:hypothetical protein
MTIFAAMTRPSYGACVGSPAHSTTDSERAGKDTDRRGLTPQAVKTYSRSLMNPCGCLLAACKQLS